MVFNVHGNADQAITYYCTNKVFPCKKPLRNVEVKVSTIARDLIKEETFKAADRVGYTREEMMNWFLRFLQMELTTLSSGDLINLQYEVRYVSRFGWFPDSVGPLKGALVLRSASRQDENEELASQQFLAGWQKDNLRAIDHILAKEKAKASRSVFINAPLPAMSTRLVSFETETGVRWVQYLEATDPSGPLQLVIFSLYAQFAGRVRRCPECMRIFLADRCNKGYCTTACQNRAGTKRYRLAHGLITGRKRGRPPKAFPVVEAEKRLKKPRGRRVY